MAQSDLLGLMDEPRMTAALIGTARDIEKRVDLNLRRLHVGEYNPRRRGMSSADRTLRVPGTMHRSIYWAVYNATGGDEYKIKFWMEAVANYVELAVQGGGVERGADGKFKSGGTRKGWKVIHGGLPAPISRVNYGGIKIDRVNSQGRTLKRKAKPFISGEVRVHGRMLFDRLIKDYAYVGNVIMASALDIRKIAPYFDDDNRDTSNKKWKENVRTMEDMLKEMSFNRNTDDAALRHQGWNPIERSDGDWQDLSLKK